MNRKKTVDYLKAFSIILVVFYHSLFTSGLCWSSMPYICLVIVLKDLHVPMFIVIAGYLCRKQDIKEFYLKKVKRILIPFLFMSCLKLIFNIFIEDSFAHSDGVLSQLYDAFVCGNLYWYCYCLLLMFLLVPLIWNSRKLKWAVIIVFTAADIILVYTGTEITGILQLTQTVYYIPLFALGMLLRDYKFFDHFKKVKNISLLAAAAVIVLGICVWLRLLLDVNNIYVLDVVLGLSCMAILFCAASFIGSNPASAVLNMLGKYSLQIMLLDSFYRVALFYIFEKIMNVNIVMALVVTALDILLSCVTCLIAEHIPGISFLMGLNRIKS